MIRSLLLLALFADGPATDPDKAASPTLPAPEGLAFVKHAGGLRSPEGFDVATAADLGADARTLAFGDDGAFLLRGSAVLPLDAAFKPGEPILKGAVAVTAYDGWLYAATAKGVVRVQGGKAEPVLTGAGVVGLGVGPDGWLYVSTEEGDAALTGTDGGKATAARTGAVFRCTPDGNRLHAFAIGLRRPAGPPAFDDAANLFHLDADLPDAGRFTGCRLVHVADAADYGYRLAPGARGGKPDPDRAAAFGERPGTMAPLLKTGRGEPHGLFMYRDTRLPEAYRGLLLYPDPYDRTVRAYRVVPDRATFRVTEEFSLLAGGEGFRPCAVTSGPDGALYVLERGGKLWRLTWKGAGAEEGLKPRDRDSWAKAAKAGDEEALKLLASDDASLRDRATLALMRRGDKAKAALLKVLADGEAGSGPRVAALVALTPLFDAEVRKAFVDALGSGDGDLQRLAADALGRRVKPGDKEVHDALLRQLAEETAPLKRAVALAIGRVAGPAAADNLASALSFDEGKCPVLRDGLLRGLEGMGQPGVKALLALMDSGSQRQIDRVAEDFLGLRSRAAFDALPGLMNNPHLNARQRAALVRSSVRYPGLSLAPLAAAVADQPDAVREAMRQALTTPGVDPGR